MARVLERAKGRSIVLVDEFARNGGFRHGLAVLAAVLQRLAKAGGYH